ncbi:unnamed protein product [Paramecium sonneborni]|uniref:Uncharacterized protein n=1 Tax=Paramecium sonneborni TaxID=65129 RepID=A0A8S1L4S7_9CILI|nr:unnamed protein product [Paramecium sonneborni]
MLYQDQRRMVNQSQLDNSKFIRPRSISNNAVLFNMDTQQTKYKTDIATNYQVSINEARQNSQNQINHSFTQGGENNPKILNSHNHYDFKGLMKSFHNIQNTKEKVKERQNNSIQDKNQLIQTKDTFSQEKQSKTLHNSQTRQIKQNDQEKEEIWRLNKTEGIQCNNKNTKENKQLNDSDIRQRIKNYPQKSSSPQLKTNTRPKSSMEDKSVTIISLQLKDMKENVQSKDIKKICQDMGYHMVKFDRNYDKINNTTNGQGCLQIRGISNENKFINLQTNLSKKGINLADQNQNLKDFISNKYLLKKQEHNNIETQPNLNQDEKLFNNFLKFQRRQKGQFI